MSAPEGNNNYLKGAVFNDALRRAITQDDGKRIRAAAEKLLDLASEGTPWAVRELIDRTDGKAFQSVQVTGEGGGAVKFEVVAPWLTSNIAARNQG